MFRPALTWGMHGLAAFSGERAKRTADGQTLQVFFLTQAFLLLSQR